MEGTEVMWVWSLTAVSARMATSMVWAKSGESIALAMLESEAEIARDVFAHVGIGQIVVEGRRVDTCRISSTGWSG